MAIKGAMGVNNPTGDPQTALGMNFRDAQGKNPKAIIDALNLQYAQHGDALAVLRTAAQFYKETKNPEYNVFVQSMYEDMAPSDDKKQALGILGGLKRSQ